MRGSSKKNSLKKTSTEDFDQFYNKFHSDSLFQISRIKFPLGGMSLEGYESTPWTKGNWLMMKTRIQDIDTTQYEISYKKTDKQFNQKVWIKDSGFSSEYKFELIDKKWYLVYVLDQNL
jgi:hypothetical protein